MNIEISRLHEDHVTTTILPEWLASPGGTYQIFETDRRNVKRRTECFRVEFLHVCEEER